MAGGFNWVADCVNFGCMRESQRHVKGKSRLVAEEVYSSHENGNLDTGGFA